MAIQNLHTRGGIAPEVGVQAVSTGGLQTIINKHYSTTTQGGCNLVIMRPGVNPVCLTAGNLPPNAPQHWGSVSKQFTAACIAKLVDQKKINWSDDIRQHLPELPEFMWESQPQKVTVDDLAHMRSGLPEMGIMAAFSGRENVMLSIEEKQKLLAHSPELLFKPGSQQMYSNDNYFLLADIVERVSGKPFIDFVRDEIFFRLEMEGRCSIDPTCPQTVDGYNSNFQLNTFTGHAWGAFGIVGPPSDMVKWNDSFERGEWNSLTAPPSNITVPQGESLYCRGVKVAYTDDYRVVYHSGSIDGVCTRFMRYEHLTDPSKTFAFFLASNINDMQRSLNAAEEIANVLGGNNNVHIERDELKEISPPTSPTEAAMSEAKPYEGAYERPALGLRYRIHAEDKNGVPILHFSLLDEDGGSHVIVNLVPIKEKENTVVYRGPAGEWIERTPDGIVLKHPKMAPIFFKGV